MCEVSMVFDVFPIPLHTPNSGILFSWISWDVKGYRSLQKFSRHRSLLQRAKYSRNISEELQRQIQRQEDRVSETDVLWGYLE